MSGHLTVQSQHVSRFGSHRSVSVIMCDFYHRTVKMIHLKSDCLDLWYPSSTYSAGRVAHLCVLLLCTNPCYIIIIIMIMLV